MDPWVVTMMLSGSLFLAGVALAGFLWAIKSGQFDDEKKMMTHVHFDDEQELNDAAQQQKKREELKKKEYRPE